MDGITACSVSAMIGVLIWYLKQSTKQQCEREKKHDEMQKDDRDFTRELVTGTLKEIHETGLKNAEMNRSSIDLQKSYQKESVGTLKIICERLNGGTEGQRAIKAMKVIDERKKKSKVKVERRA